VAEREVAVQHRERLARMKADKDMFMEKLRAERKTLYLVSLSCARVCHEVHVDVFLLLCVSAGQTEGV
jgi:hypothetical protein